MIPETAELLKGGHDSYSEMVDSKGSVLAMVLVRRWRSASDKALPLGEYNPARIKSISAGNENIVNCRRSKEHKECELSELPRGCITYSKARAQVMRLIMESLSGA